MLRALDIIFSLMGLVLGFPVLLVIYLLGLFDTGAPLFRQERVGRYQKPFTLVKFRTMRVGTASVASHLADVNAITPMGQFLRRTKLDELPQLWNVLWGDMSLVGPRPGLFNQKELLQAREQHGVLRRGRALPVWRKSAGLICPRLNCWHKQMPRCCLDWDLVRTFATSSKQCWGVALAMRRASNRASSTTTFPHTHI